MAVKGSASIISRRLQEKDSRQMTAHRPPKTVISPCHLFVPLLLREGGPSLPVWVDINPVLTRAIVIVCARRNSAVYPVEAIICWNMQPSATICMFTTRLFFFIA
jgi:hypothetical protein